MSDLPPLPPPGAGPEPPPSSLPGDGADDVSKATRRSIVLIVSLAVAVLLVGVGVGFVVTDDGPSDPVAVTTTEPTDPDPDTTASSDPVDTEPPSSGTATSSVTTTTGSADGGASVDPEIRDMVKELSDYVAQQRGRPFKEPVVVELATDDEFEQRLLSDFEEEQDHLRETERIFGALGLLEDDVDLGESLKQLLSVGVLGFYDPETDELVVRGAADTPYTRITIVHELTHAWDDQWFDLDRPEIDEADDESGFGFSALVEGDARRVESRYRASLTDDERRSADREEAVAAAPMLSVIGDIPMILIELISAPYELGESLTLLLEDAGGEERVDAAFDAPPLNSSVVLHPDRFLAGIEEVKVDAPPADGEVFDEGVFGELVLVLLLRDEMSSQRAALQAADAWAGDWYVTWDEGDQTCVRVDFATFGSERDRADFRDGLDEWVQAQDDASLRTVGDLLRMTACG